MSTGITVSERPDGAFDVALSYPGGLSEHVVTVPDGYAGDLSWEGTELELVETSLAFLLVREPATSILSEFSLDVIARYFPEYPQVMRNLAQR